MYIYNYLYCKYLVFAFALLYFVLCFNFTLNYYTLIRFKLHLLMLLLFFFFLLDVYVTFSFVLASKITADFQLFLFVLKAFLSCIHIFSCVFLFLLFVFWLFY